MLELEKRRGGFRPSPGSIYPALQMLEDAEFVRGREVEGKRVYEITDSGRESLKEHTEKGGFDRDADEESVREMFVGGASSLRSLIEAAKQVARLGNPRLIRATVDILDEARRDIYKLLAEDE
jgi:DNA-binding PadR family transcriptional regulator